VAKEQQQQPQPQAEGSSYELSTAALSFGGTRAAFVLALPPDLAEQLLTPAPGDNPFEGVAVELQITVCDGSGDRGLGRVLNSSECPSSIRGAAAAGSAPAGGQAGCLQTWQALQDIAGAGRAWAQLVLLLLQQLLQLLTSA